MLDDMRQLRKERVVLIGSIKPAVTVGPAFHQAGLLELTQLFLNSGKREFCHAREFTDIPRRLRRSEEHS
jgi:hypothetical protein